METPKTGTGDGGGILSKALGANWQTTVWGSLAAFGGSISTLLMAVFAASLNPATASTPEVQFLMTVLPPRVKFWVTVGGAVLTAFAGTKFAIASKSKNVTGGIVQQDNQGNVAEIQEKTPAPPLGALPESKDIPSTRSSSTRK